MTMSKRERLIRDLRATKAQFEKRGWTQGTLRKGDGSVCALGAIGYATIPNFHADYGQLRTSEPAQQVINAVAKHMPQVDLEPEDVIISNNDDEATTYSDIVHFFDKALAEAGGLS